MNTEKAYLRRLDEELRDLPAGRRRELVDEIREHIAEASPADEAELRTVLDRLGDPADIAAEARAAGSAPPEKRMGFHEVAAVILLVIGGLLFPLIGWIIGVALLWGSSAWSRRDKLIGTFLFPGGFAGPFFIFAGGWGGYTCMSDGVREVCEGKPGPLEYTVIMTVLVLGTVGTLFSAVHLSQRARRGAY
jgi:hypothetical protein